MNPSDTANAAMTAVMNKDRQAWLSCFAENAILRDPVGGSPLDPDGTGLVGKEALGSFWDKVVSPAGRVEFTVREEHVSGRSVARVATVRIEKASGDPLQYDGVFVYDLDGSGAITHLHGYFSLPDW